MLCDTALFFGGEERGATVACLEAGGWEMACGLRAGFFAAGVKSLPSTTSCRFLPSALPAAAARPGAFSLPTSAVGTLETLAVPSSLFLSAAVGEAGA